MAEFNESGQENQEETEVDLAMKELSQLVQEYSSKPDEDMPKKGEYSYGLKKDLAILEKALAVVDKPNDLLSDEELKKKSSLILDGGELKVRLRSLLTPSKSQINSPAGIFSTDNPQSDRMQIEAEQGPDEEEN